LGIRNIISVGGMQIHVGKKIAGTQTYYQGHDACYEWLSVSAQNRTLPKGLPIIIIDRHSDLYYDPQKDKRTHFMPVWKHEYPVFPLPDQLVTLKKERRVFTDEFSHLHGISENYLRILRDAEYIDAAGFLLPKFSGQRTDFNLTGLEAEEENLIFYVLRHARERNEEPEELGVHNWLRLAIEHGLVGTASWVMPDWHDYHPRKVLDDLISDNYDSFHAVYENYFFQDRIYRGINNMPLITGPVIITLDYDFFSFSYTHSQTFNINGDYSFCDYGLLHERASHKPTVQKIKDGVDNMERVLKERIWQGMTIAGFDLSPSGTTFVFEEHLPILSALLEPMVERLARFQDSLR